MAVFEANRDLLDRFRRGERAALEKVYEHYVDSVAVLVRRGFTVESSGHLYVPGADGVETEHELIQDTFVRAFSESARLAYDGLRPYRPYLLRVTKNLMIDRMRARRRDAVSLGVEPAELDAVLDDAAELAPPADPIEDTLEWRQLSAATAEFVATLDDESRELIRLRFGEGLSQSVVAARLGCTRRRVRTVERRVELGLRNYLRRHVFRRDPDRGSCFGLSRVLRRRGRRVAAPRTW